MDTDFYVINKPTKKKRIGGSCLNQLKEFQELSLKLDKCVDGCLLTFYQNVLNHFIGKNGIRKPKKEKKIPSLFIQGECVCWDVVFEKITDILKDKIILICVTPSNICMRSFKEQVKKAEAEKRVMLVFILQVESFTRSSFIDNVIEVMTESFCSKFLTFNAAINYSMILDRISRVNYTTLEVELLELEPPINLLYSIYDQLLRHNVLRIQFSADVLMKTYLRFMHECYSVLELKKCFNMALTDYAFDENRNFTAPDYLSKWSQYFSLANVLNKFEFVDTNSDQFYSFLKLHCKIQNDSNFVNNYITSHSVIWKNWKRCKWDCNMKLLEESLNDFPDLKWFSNEIIQIRRQLNEEPTSSNGASDRNPSPGRRLDVTDVDDDFIRKLNVGPLSPARQRVTTANFLTQRGQDYQRPSGTLLSSIQTLLHNLMDHVLIRFPAEFVAKIPQEQMEYLQTSNMPKMDEIMNGRVEIDDSRFQIDVVTLYHVLVDESSETLTTDLGQAFQNFQASFKGSSILGDCDLETRFFHALAQMEYLGIIAMNADNSCRLVYLPASMALNDKKDLADEFLIEDD